MALRVQNFFYGTTDKTKVLERPFFAELVVEAAERFLNGPFRRFPVVVEGRLVEIISRPDALRALFRLG